MGSLEGCRVTMFNRPRIRNAPGRGGPEFPKCGQPVVCDGLCAKHLADRERLGSAA